MHGKNYRCIEKGRGGWVPTAARFIIMGDRIN